MPGVNEAHAGVGVRPVRENTETTWGGGLIRLGCLGSEALETVNDGASRSSRNGPNFKSGAASVLVLVTTAVSRSRVVGVSMLATAWVLSVAVSTGVMAVGGVVRRGSAW